MRSENDIVRQIYEHDILGYDDEDSISQINMHLEQWAL